MSTEYEVRSRLEWHVGNTYGSHTAAAKAWGVSDSFVSNVLRGRKPPTNAMLAEIGMQKRTVTVYEPLTPNA